jgi:hypothetical protein
MLSEQAQLPDRGLSGSRRRLAGFGDGALRFGVIEIQR